MFNLFRKKETEPVEAEPKKCDPEICGDCGCEVRDDTPEETLFKQSALINALESSMINMQMDIENLRVILAAYMLKQGDTKLEIKEETFSQLMNSETQVYYHWDEGDLKVFLEFGGEEDNEQE